MLHHLIIVWFDWVHDWGYLGIIILMAMESSVLPVPAEVVIPPAAFWAAQGKLSIAGVIIAGTFGSWLGAAIMYWICRFLERFLVVKFGRYFFLTEEKIARAERWLRRYESGGIFFARLLPVIRHLISIPAGIIKMNFLRFSVMTVFGSAVWCSVLAYFGHKAYQLQPDLIQNPEAMMHFIKHQSVWIIAIIVVLTILYLVVVKLTEPKSTDAKPEKK